jgi:uncharacterized membrane protein YkvA (DUF1232 family)
MKLADAFEKTKIKARIKLQNRKELLNLKSAVEKKVESSKGRLSEGLNDIYTLLRLLAAYATGEYREIAIRSMVAVVAALVYFLNPMDVIPDFITGFGYLDDLTVLAYVIRTFKDEIDKFISWEMDGKDVLGDEQNEEV